MSNIDATLQERGSRYGEFEDHAAVTQGIKQAMQDSKNWDSLEYDMVEALEMVAHKIGRILNGDPSYIDSWTDIIGYTRLVEKRLIAQNEPKLASVDEKCDDENCPGCHPENRVSLAEMLAAALGGKARAEALVKAAEPKPALSDITKALDTLLAAGVITHA